MFEGVKVCGIHQILIRHVVDRVIALVQVCKMLLAKLRLTCSQHHLLLASKVHLLQLLVTLTLVLAHDHFDIWALVLMNNLVQIVLIRSYTFGCLSELLSAHLVEMSIDSV